MKSVRIGCSGWNYTSWRERFYPKGLPARLWLEHYSQVFDTVEVNNTFYRLPNRDAVANWVKQSPDGFVFAVKASRYLTHIKRLADMDQGVGRYWERIEPLADSPKMGPVLWQLPGNFQRDDDRLRHALERLPKRTRHCFEFRHESWFHEDVYKLLRKHRAALVIGDTPERPFQTYEITAKWTFVRFHYGRRGRNGNYSKTEIEEWAERLDNWRKEVEIYAYFNNDWEAYAVHNAIELKRLLGV
jgi:uncharacterized protein YecE (DUF72 family)